MHTQTSVRPFEKYSILQRTWLACCIFLALHHGAMIASARQQPSVPAFPGAIGWGAETIGGRGGQVLVVTTLEDRVENPPVGSLRWALEQEGPRTIVFAVGGVIRLQGELYVGHGDDAAIGQRRGFVTVAGQSAPAPGITIAGDAFLIQDTKQVVLRHLRIRTGLVPFSGPFTTSACRFDPDQGPTFTIKDGLGISRSTQVIVDHCSVTWATDELFAISDSLARTPEGPGSDRITIQHSLLAECFDTWHWRESPAGFTKAHDSGPILIWNVVRLNATIWGNALWSNERRSPVIQPRDERAAHYRIDLCGNVIGSALGPEGFDVDVVDNTDLILDLDVIGNRFTNTRMYKRANQPIERTFVRVYWGSNNLTRAGNPVPYPTSKQDDDTGAFRMTSSASYSPNWVTSTSIEWSVPALTGQVGATLPAVDHIDARIHADVISEDVRLVNTLAAGQFRMNELALLPDLASPARHPPEWDADADGMRDGWESLYGVFSPTLDRDQDGYTNIEEYLNGSNPGCGADFDGDGAVGSADFFCFIKAFFAGGESADFNQDGEVNTGDFFAFVSTFFGSCGM